MLDAFSYYAGIIGASLFIALDMLIRISQAVSDITQMLMQAMPKVAIMTIIMSTSILMHTLNNLYMHTYS